MAQTKPAYLDIYLNLVNHVELLTDKLQQDLESRLTRLNKKNVVAPPVQRPTVTPPTSTPIASRPPVEIPTNTDPAPEKTGTIHGTKVPNPAVTQGDKKWWTKLPAWRGFRGILRWLWYGYHKDNLDYEPYMKDWVEVFSKDRLKLTEYVLMQNKSEDIAEQFTQAVCQEFIESTMYNLSDLRNLIDEFKGAIRKAVFNAIKQVYELSKAGTGTMAPTNHAAPPEAAKGDMSKRKAITPTPKDEPSTTSGNSKLQPVLSPQTDSDLPGPPPVRKGRIRGNKKIENPAPDSRKTPPGDKVKPLVGHPEPEDEAERNVPSSLVTDDSAEVLYGTKKLTDNELQAMKLSWDQRAEILKTIESKMSGSKETPLKQRKHKEWKDGKAGREKAYQYLKSKGLVPESLDDLKYINANTRLRKYIEIIFHVTPKAAENLIAYIKTREKKSDLPVGGQPAKSEKEVDAEVDDMLSRLEEHIIWEQLNRRLYEEMTAEEKKHYFIDLLRKGKHDTFIPRMKVNNLPWNEKIGYYKNLLRA